MFKRSFITAIFLTLLFAITAQAQVPTSGQVNRTANLRGGPGTTFPIVGGLATGATVQIAACNDDCNWYQVGEDQWIAAFLVTPVTVQATPVVSTTLQPITFISWNVESGGALQSAVADRLTSFENVDIFGLSEVNAIDAEAFEFGAEGGENVDYESYLGTTGAADRLLLIWDTTRFTLVGSGQLIEIGFSGRAPLWIQLEEQATGVEFIVMVNHLHRSDEETRHRQAQMLNAWGASQTLPVIALGDYNFDWNLPNGDADHDVGYDNLTKDGVWEWIRPAELVTTQCSGWPCGYNSVLDFVFVTGPARNWNISSEIIVVANDFPDDLTTPDHRPLLAVVMPDSAVIALAPIVAVTNTVLVTTPTIVATVIPTAAPTITPTATTPASTCPQTTSTANLRSGPGTSYPTAGRLQAGECVVITGRTEVADWYQLSNGNWIAEFLVINVGPLANIPVTFTAPPSTATAMPAQPTAALVVPTAIPLQAQPTPVPPTPLPAAPTQNCDPSYPDFCLEPGIADLDCGDIPQYAGFTVLQPDPHGFDGTDNDGLGCESN